MVVGSSEPLTKPFSASVANLTVCRVIVEPVSDTRSGSTDAARASEGSAQAAASNATAKSMRMRKEARFAIWIAFVPAVRIGLISQWDQVATPLMRGRAASGRKDDGMRTVRIAGDFGRFLSCRTGLTSL